MSFTRGPLFLQESLTLLELHKTHQDWKLVRKHAVEENALQTRTLTTLKNTCGEIISRLKHLTSAECAWILKASTQEQAYLLWVAICRRYAFIADFAVEVLRCLLYTSPSPRDRG